MTEWRKSSFSGGNTNCVEVAATPDQVAVRDSKDPAAPHLTFSFSQWLRFTGMDGTASARS